MHASDEELDPFADALAANWAGLEGGATLHAGGVATLKHKLDVVIDTDGASDALLHLPVTRLQLLQQVVLFRALRVWTAVYLRLVYKRSQVTSSDLIQTTVYIASRASDP